MQKQRSLLWIDLEMTGLNPKHDVILEIASVITTSQLDIIAQGPSLVIHQSTDVLSRMNKEVRDIHTKSGLVEHVATSTTTIIQAEQMTVDFIAQHAQKGELLLSGNSVWQDRNFLIAYMPRIMEYLHYRIIDVSTIKELIRAWYPNNPAIHFKKQENHRAHEDVLASIEELKHYRSHFFIS